jgi:hypothetical protein
MAYLGLAELTKLEPLTTSRVPPRLGPLAGEMCETTGVERYVYCTRELV